MSDDWVAFSHHDQDFDPRASTLSDESVKRHAEESAKFNARFKNGGKKPFQHWSIVIVVVLVIVMAGIMVGMVFWGKAQRGDASVADAVVPRPCGAKRGCGGSAGGSAVVGSSK
jgi:hypothetical protein